MAIQSELQSQLDECRKEHGELDSELEVRVKTIKELEIRIKLLLEVEIKIKLELEVCRASNDELQKQLDECREEKVILELELKVCEMEAGELQRQLEDTRKMLGVLAEANEAVTKAYDAEKAKIMKEIEEFKE